MTDRECVALLQWATPRLGLRWEGFRRVRGQACKRIARRIAELRLAGAAEYRVRLEADPAEWAVLDGLARITISRFYRDRAVFEALGRDVLPELLRAAEQRGTPLRCWSAGCASGEEPYSLAILLRLALRAANAAVLATDADPALLDRARTARYSRATLRDLPDAWMEAFEPRDGLWQLKPEYQALVEFRCEDLRARMPRGPFELVLCRNLVFTYFEASLQRRLLDELASRIVPGGALVIGWREALPPGEHPLEQLSQLPVFRRIER